MLGVIYIKQRNCNVFLFHNIKQKSSLSKIHAIIACMILKAKLFVILFGIVKSLENDLRIIILMQNKIKLSANYFSSKNSKLIE